MKYWRRAVCYLRPVNAFENVEVNVPATLCQMPKKHMRKGYFRFRQGREEFVRACAVGGRK